MRFSLYYKQGALTKYKNKMKRLKFSQKNFIVETKDLFNLDSYI